MNKIFIHMDEGWPGFCRTNRGANGGRIYHVRADHYYQDNGAPYSLGCCALEAGVVASDVRISTDTIIYMLSRLRQKEGYDIDSYPLCMWNEGGQSYIRIGWRVKQLEYLGDTEYRVDFIEWLETQMDKTFTE
jgi:hypothetical protein